MTQSEKLETTFNDIPVKVVARVFNLVAIEVTEHSTFNGDYKQIVWVRPEWLKNLPSIKEYDDNSDVIFDGTAK